MEWWWWKDIPLARKTNPVFDSLWEILDRWDATELALFYELDARLRDLDRPDYRFGVPFAYLTTGMEIIVGSMCGMHSNVGCGSFVPVENLRRLQPGLALGSHLARENPSRVKGYVHLKRDQVDLRKSDPELLREFISIVRGLRREEGVPDPKPRKGGRIGKLPWRLVEVFDGSDVEREKVSPNVIVRKAIEQRSRGKARFNLFRETWGRAWDHALRDPGDQIRKEEVERFRSLFG